ISAASYKSSGISCNPAKNKIILNPTVHQRVAIRMDNQPNSQLPNQGISIYKASANNPVFDCKINTQILAITDTDNIYGIKNIILKNNEPFNLAFTNKAKSNPPITIAGVDIAIK